MPETTTSIIGLTPARRREIGAALYAVAVEIAAIKAAKKEERGDGEATAGEKKASPARAERITDPS